LTEKRVFPERLLGFCSAMLAPCRWCRVLLVRTPSLRRNAR